MGHETPFEIGVKARCTDGVCGWLKQVVIDPVKDVVTHVIVEPEHREGLGRLVPIDLVKATDDGVEINATVSAFESLPRAEETHFLPGIEGEFPYDPEEVLLWPYFGGNTTVPVTVDTVPVGEVAVRRGQQVNASDGKVGEVEGLIVDADNHHVTHLLLKEGHIFDRKEVAVPISAVKAVREDVAEVALSKKEIEDLPPVSFSRRG